MECSYLFVYGTLKKGFTNPTAQYLHSTQRFIGEAFFPGKLFKVSFYPGAVYLPDFESNVHGHLFEIVSHPDELFKRLDEYEVVGQEFESPHEFRKEVIPIHYSEKTVQALTYLFNIAYDRYPLIPSGLFKK